MKGITPVIATILLLLITISMVGFAFVWFSRVTTTAGTQIENQTLNQVNQAAKVIRIEALKTTAPATVSVRNSGTAVFPVSEISVFIDGAPVLTATCATAPEGTAWTGDISPNVVRTCRLYAAAGTACPANSVVVVTSPGGTEDRRVC